VPLSISAYPDGHLRVTIDQIPPANALLFDTPQLVVGPGGKAVFTVTWNNGQIQVRINGQPVPAVSMGTEPLHLDPPLPVVAEQALGHPDAIQKCSQWIQWRQSQLAVKRHARYDRRTKTTEEQVNELRAAIATVQHLCFAIQAGEMFLVLSLATTLRSLLFWKKGSQYDPLLLRLAAIQDLPLPTFAFPRWAARPSIIDQANYHLIPDIASLNRKYPGQELMDIQDALLNSVQIQRTQTVGSRKPTVDTLTALDLVTQTANMMGTAHFDPDVGLALDRLQCADSYVVECGVSNS
jgi:hypothetical protein